MSGQIATRLDRYMPADWQAGTWGTSALLALVGHGLLVIALLPWMDLAVADAGSPVVMVEFAHHATAPQVEPSDLPPGPEHLAPRPDEQAARAEKQQQVADLDAFALTSPLERPAVTLPQRTTEPEAASEMLVQPAPSVPPRAAIAAETAASPAPGLSNASTAKALAAWQRLLVAHLERFKRYPREARAQEGVSSVAFSIDRQGRVLSTVLVRSSGSPVLDADAIALVRRAEPLPAPPGDIGDGELTQVAPIRYVAAHRK